MSIRCIGDVLRNRIHATVAPNTRMSVVCRLFRVHGFDAIPVCERGRLVGIIKRRETTLHQFRPVEWLDRERARDVMQPVHFSIGMQFTFAQALQAFLENNETLAAVTNKCGHVVGVLAESDIPTAHRQLVQRMRHKAALARIH